MLRSLVGSEMCIRDRISIVPPGHPCRFPFPFFFFSFFLSSFFLSLLSFSVFPFLFRFVLSSDRRCLCFLYRLRFFVSLPCFPWRRILLLCYFVSVLHPPSLLASLKYAYSPCVLSSFLRSCFVYICHFSSLPFFFFRFRFWTSFCFILSFSCGCYAVSSVSVSAATRLAYMICILIRTLIPFYFSCAGYTICLSDTYVCIIFCFSCFPPEVIFRFRVDGACPVTTDCIVAIS